ncbi:MULTISPECIES: asparagine synthase-related protein [Deefgea]|uniref:asparagine synthase (glutamine-hydrolyzing) n=1 Tax=Deefgea chitinilytica TaxID=570276 RepID=A0ABS2CBP9_9NEIS|nr:MULTISPECIES: asparagine synthetase B family protein [Deefgea]MBM5571573.1 DUF1933 domain-containing protein [Deefgea chitinilytica]MBM9888808.1 asparagine synthase [Deefgea sp. CFH1-16]
MIDCSFFKDARSYIATSSVYFCGYAYSSLPEYANIYDGTLLELILKQHAPARLAEIAHGKWVAVIADKNSIFLACDLYAQAQLFYTENAGHLHIANSLDRLIQNGHHEFEHQYISQMANNTVGLSNFTPYRGIYRLAPGQCIIFSRGQKHIVRGEAKFRKLPIPDNLEDCAITMRHLVENGLKQSLRGITNPIFELSGGLDSSTVVAAQKSISDQIQTLTWNMPGDDDGKYAEIFCRHHQLSFNPIDVSKFPITIEQPPCGEPGNEFSQFLGNYLTGLTQKREKLCIITGVGGDNIFWARGIPPYWLNRTLANKGIAATLTLCKQGNDHRFSSRSGLSLFLQYAIKPTFLPWRTENLFIKIFRGLTLEPTIDFFSYQLAITMANRCFVNHLNPQLDFRNPLLHFPLVEYCCSFAGHFEKQLREGRLVQREAFKNELPTEILERSSKGGDLQREMEFLTNAGTISELCNSPFVTRLGLINKDQWKELLKHASAGHFQNLSQFDFLLKLEIWLRNNSHKFLNL